MGDVSHTACYEECGIAPTKSAYSCFLHRCPPFLSAICLAGFLGGQNGYFFFLFLRLNWEDKAQAEVAAGAARDDVVPVRHTAASGEDDPAATTVDAVRA